MLYSLTVYLTVLGLPTLTKLYKNSIILKTEHTVQPNVSHIHKMAYKEVHTDSPSNNNLVITLLFWETLTNALRRTIISKYYEDLEEVRQILKLKML
jgi:hypothetical protein